MPLCLYAFVNHDTYVYFKDLTPSREFFLYEVFIAHLASHHNFRLFTTDPKLPVSIVFNYFLYYSFKDISIPLGLENIRLELTKKNRTIFQRRNNYGNIVTDLTFNGTSIRFRSIFKDLYGLDSSGLEKLVKSFGVPFEKNKGLNTYKVKMSLALKDIPETFLVYAIKDALALADVLPKILDSFNTMLKNDYVLWCFESNSFFYRIISSLYYWLFSRDIIKYL
jgi:hypothetical protein